jgi:hypothetical protein
MWAGYRLGREATGASKQMSTVRVKKDKNFSVINNTVLNDVRLSWQAKGLAAYLLSRPDDWRIIRTHLAKQSADGEGVVRSSLKELEKCGYLVTIRRQNEHGHFEWEHTLHETPQEILPLTIGENPPVVKPPVVKPLVDNRALLSTEVVSTEVVSSKRKSDIGDPILLVAETATAHFNSEEPPAPEPPQLPAIPKITVTAALAVQPNHEVAIRKELPWQPVLDDPPTKRDIAAAEQDRIDRALNGSGTLKPKENHYGNKNTTGHLPRRGRPYIEPIPGDARRCNEIARLAAEAATLFSARMPDLPADQEIPF